VLTAASRAVEGLWMKKSLTDQRVTPNARNGIPAVLHVGQLRMVRFQQDVRMLEK